MKLNAIQEEKKAEDEKMMNLKIPKEVQQFFSTQNWREKLNDMKLKNPEEAHNLMNMGKTLGKIKKRANIDLQNTLRRASTKTGLKVK